MKLNKIALIALLSVKLFGCSQEKLVELPLTIQNDHSPFGVWFAGMGAI